MLCFEIFVRLHRGVCNLSEKDFEMIVYIVKTDFEMIVNIVKTQLSQPKCSYFEIFVALLSVVLIDKFKHWVLM